jgi:hypothetical protein
MVHVYVHVCITIRSILTICNMPYHHGTRVRTIEHIAILPYCNIARAKSMAICNTMVLEYEYHNGTRVLVFQVVFEIMLYLYTCTIMVPWYHGAIEQPPLPSFRKRSFLPSSPLALRPPAVALAGPPSIGLLLLPPRLVRAASVTGVKILAHFRRVALLRPQLLLVTERKPPCMSSTSAAQNRILSLLRTMSSDGGGGGVAAAAVAGAEPAAKKVKSSINRKGVSDVDFAGQRVLVRVDFNVPQDKKTGAHMCCLTSKRRG